MQFGSDVVPTPSVVNWYRGYCVAMILLYVACVLFGSWLIQNAEDEEEYTLGLILIVMSVPIGLVYAAALFFPRRRWAWVFHLVLICGGMTSSCCLPVCIPLLIYWIKPETKHFFGFS